MATEEIEISQLELADEILADMVTPVETATETKAITLSQLKKWLGSPLPTGLIFPAVGRIDNSRFTLLDGKTLSRNGTYAEFCEEVIEQVNAGNWYSCTQSEYDEDLSNYGQCGRFVIETDYVRIPTITRYIGATITLSEIGKTYAESLPNITGSTVAGLQYPISFNGAFYSTTAGNKAPDADYGGNGLGFDASRSSSTYKDGAKVNPEHTKYPYYMVISTTGQIDEVEIDINNVYEDINLKANKDLSDVSQAGKERVVGWGMPDYDAGISIPEFTYNNTTYKDFFTAPTDGILSLMFLYNNAGTDNITINGNYMTGFGAIYDTAGGCILKLNKGDKVGSYRNVGTGRIGRINFFPYKGVNNA